MGENAPKIIIVVLVLIVVLFVVGLGVGGSGTNGDQGGIEGISVDGVVARVSSILPSPPLSLDQITTDCLQPGTGTDPPFIEVAAGSMCQLLVAASPPGLLGVPSAIVRTLKLQMVTGVSVQIELNSPPNRDDPSKTMTVTDTLTVDEQPSLNFYAVGGTLTIICQASAGSTCKLNVVG